MGDQPSITRRGVLVGAGAVAGMFAVGGVAYALEGEDRGLLRPPGAQDEAHFRATCLKCIAAKRPARSVACARASWRTACLTGARPSWIFIAAYATFAESAKTCARRVRSRARMIPRRSSASRSSTASAASHGPKAVARCALTHARTGPSRSTTRIDPLSTRRNAMDAARARTHARRTATSRSPAAPTAASTCAQQGRRHRR